jgi:hypothetical protein
MFSITTSATWRPVTGIPFQVVADLDLREERFGFEPVDRRTPGAVAREVSPSKAAGWEGKRCGATGRSSVVDIQWRDRVESPALAVAQNNNMAALTTLSASREPGQKPMVRSAHSVAPDSARRCWPCEVLGCVEPMRR